ncbi:MAG: isochorismate synthase [Ignavibacteriaceae bacterium]
MKIYTEIILKDFSAFTKTFGKLDEPHLVSFSFPLERFDPLTLIDKLNEFYDDIFFFRIPKNRLIITGLNSAIELTSVGASQFSSISKILDYWKKNIVKNWNEINFGTVPIVCCTAKFDPFKSSALWNDFEPLRIYIPEFILTFQDGNVTGFYNFILDKNKSNAEILNRLLTYLNKFEDLSKIPSEYSEPKIYSTLVSGKEEVNGWQETFNGALTVLNTGRVEKLVLSRAYSFKFNNKFNWKVLLNNLSERFNDCYLFFIKRKSSFFFGSSPEMFLKVTGNNVEVESVAGSAPRGEKIEADNQYEKALQTSEKNHQEHLFVSDFISEILIRYSDNVRIIEEKQIRKLDNIQHLITRISGELNFKNKLFELIDSLYPTPAVCGVPKELAMRTIRKIEPHDRGLYSGIIGLMDFNANCELAVSIRSALVKENTVTAFAGAGLVKNSNSDEELLETNLKLNTILSLFGNENKSK